MKREEFLATFGIGLATVCAGACFTGCGKGDAGSPDPGNGPVIKPPAGINFTVNLASQLTAVGESLSNSGVIVVRIAAGNSVSSFTAVQLACTHEGTSINYSANQGKFICPNHGSTFANSGTVLNGPATASLKVYTVAIAGTTLTVTG